jgi:ubiquinone/menaquinone biosynthesis C-methylase UbiE
MQIPVERLSERRWMPPWLRYQHLERYRWVSGLTVGRSVIDAACGTGYGAALLARDGARQVLAFDLAPEAIEEARRLYQADPLRFEVADVTRLPVPDRSCDAFVSFETIEHVQEAERFLAEVVRVLRPGGTFYCSTPNRVLTNAGTTIHDRPYNRYHVREYSAGELRSLLSRYFPSVRVVGQTNYPSRYARLLGRIGKRIPRAAVRLHQFRKLLGLPWERPARHHPGPWPDGSEPEVLLAICEAPEGVAR